MDFLPLVRLLLHPAWAEAHPPLRQAKRGEDRHREDHRAEHPAEEQRGKVKDRVHRMENPPREERQEVIRRAGREKVAREMTKEGRR